MKHLDKVINVFLSSSSTPNFYLEYLQANNQDSLTVLALHELGNLMFYDGNTRLEYLG